MTDPSLDARYFERLCHSVSFALIATDDQLRIRFWNDMANHTFGARAESMMGQPIIGIFPEDVRTAAQTLIETALRDGQAGDLEFGFRDPAGRPLLLTAVISPIHTGEGTRAGVSVGIRDITRRRELTRQLNKARKMASLGAVAGGVAHHFNSILGGAMTRLEFVLSSMRTSDRLKRDIERVLDAIGRAARISGQLLSFAEGDHEPGPPQELATIVREFISEKATEMASRSIRVQLNLAPIQPLTTESRRMKGVLESLVQNAFDAMPKGGDLTVSLAEDGEYALLIIADTGCGIPEDKFERLFEPFFTTKGSLGGGAGKNTGLSLSVVHSFITDMQGRIEAFSVVGQGTRFEIRLPYNPAPTESALRDPA